MPSLIVFQCSANSPEFKDRALIGCLTILALLKVDSAWLFVYQHEILNIIYAAYNKQLLDVVEHDIMNYQNRGLCYLPKPKLEADNTDTRF